jgi:hypothetical protein
MRAASLRSPVPARRIGTKRAATFLRLFTDSGVQPLSDLEREAMKLPDSNRA